MRFPTYKRPPVKVDKKPKVEEKHLCRDCSHHYGDFQRNADGKPFLCHCDLGDKAPVKCPTDFTKFYKFLDDEACIKFNKINGN